MHATPWRRVLAAGLGAGLIAILSSATTRPAQAATAGTAGDCKDALGVTVVVDYQDLGAFGSSTGKTTTRCAPTRTPGKPFTGTALQALTGAGFSVKGTSRWGNAFTCRIRNRPAPTETVPIPGDPTYREKCIDTPPASAFWGSWHAANGGTWTYSTEGASTRKVTGGTFEGWSFSHNQGSGKNPPPRVTPKRPALQAPAPAPASKPAGTTSKPAGTTSKPATTPATTAPPVAPAPAATSAPSANPTSAPTATPFARPPHQSARAGGAATAGDPSAAGTWLEGQLNPDGTMPAPFGDQPDFGLTVDALWALQVTGASDEAIRHTWAALSTPSAVAGFTGPGYYGQVGMPDVRLGGPSAKLLLAAATVGADVSDVGGRDLRKQTLALIAPSGAEEGRIRDVGTGSDSTNILGQALGVMGLAATGDVPRSVVDYLLSQQCSTGYLRLYNDDGRSCDDASPAAAPSDTDGTSLAIEAMIAAKADGADVPQSAIDSGVGWLRRTQHSDGSFGGGVGTEGSNSNSTGLAAAALQAGGDSIDAAAAGAWVAALQATPQSAAGTALRGDLGAIAYDRAAWTDGLSFGADAAPDQWRRATAQAVFALSPLSLASLVGTGPGPGSTGTGPTGTGPTGTGPTGTGPTGTGPTGTEPTGGHSGGHTGGGAGGSPTSGPSAMPGGASSSGPHLAARDLWPTRKVFGPDPTPSSTARVLLSVGAGQPSAAPQPVAASTTRSSGSSTATPAIAGTAANAAGGGTGHATAAAVVRTDGASANGVLGLSPLAWAILAGLLLGALVVLRPWQLLPRGQHTR